jgi:uncharacterized membrane protein
MGTRLVMMGFPFAMATMTAVALEATDSTLVADVGHDLSWSWLIIAVAQRQVIDRR